MQPKNAYDVFQQLKDHVRVFKIEIDGEDLYIVHANKTRDEWRADLRTILAESVTCGDGHATDAVYNNMLNKLRDLGYVELDDIVSDVYEGRTATNAACIMDNPAHEENVDGFGHYGWESK